MTPISDSSLPGDSKLTPKKDESPPESARSPYRSSLRGLGSGVLGALWSGTPAAGGQGHTEAGVQRPETGLHSHTFDRSSSSGSTGDSDDENADKADEDEYVKITRRLQQMDAAKSDSFHTPVTTAGASRSADDQSWLNKSVSKVLGWTHHIEEVNTPRGQEIVHNLSEQLTTQANKVAKFLPHFDDKVTAEDLEDLFVWKDVSKSAKVAGIGGYALLCMRHLVNGVELVQPSTVLAAISICCILGSAFLAPKFGGGQDASKEGKQKARRTSSSKRLIRDQMEERVTNALSKLIPLLTAICCLVSKHLTGEIRKGKTVWLAVTLWAVIIIGESGWIAQATLAMYLWTALFTLPSVYASCQPNLDGLVEDSIAFAGAAFRKERRKASAGAVAIGVAVFVLLEARFFIRLTVAMLSSLACLIWYDRYTKSAGGISHFQNIKKHRHE